MKIKTRNAREHSLLILYNAARLTILSLCLFEFPMLSRLLSAIALERDKHATQRNFQYKDEHVQVRGIMDHAIKRFRALRALVASHENYFYTYCCSSIE